MGVIYRIINNINNKSYIGQTKHNATYRWRQHVWEANNPQANQSRKLNNAIRKYGEDSFTVTTICECNNDELNTLEIHYIALYDTYNSGYNLTTGGNAPTQVSESTRAKLSAPRGPVSYAINRKRAEDNNLDKYIKHYITDKSEGYKVSDHPNLLGKSVSFTRSDQSMEFKLTQAKDVLNALNNNTYVLDTKVEPKGVQPIPNGYRVRIKGYPVKTFQKKNMTMEHKLQLATMYADSIYISKESID